MSDIPPIEPAIEESALRGMSIGDFPADAYIAPDCEARPFFDSTRAQNWTPEWSRAAIRALGPPERSVVAFIIASRSQMPRSPMRAEWLIKLKTDINCAARLIAEAGWVSEGLPYGLDETEIDELLRLVTRDHRDAAGALMAYARRISATQFVEPPSVLSTKEKPTKNALVEESGSIADIVSLAQYRRVRRGVHGAWLPVVEEFPDSFAERDYTLEVREDCVVKRHAPFDLAPRAALAYAQRDAIDLLNRSRVESEQKDAVVRLNSRAEVGGFMLTAALTGRFPAARA
jgi:hypothetical protein